MTISEWIEEARALGDTVLHRGSDWYRSMAIVARQDLVPRHWVPEDDTGRRWAICPERAVTAAFRDVPLTVQVGRLHAESREAARMHRPQATGTPTVVGLRPSMLIELFRRARLTGSCHILQVGTGTGYAAALLAHRYWSESVTTVETDPELLERAVKRMARMHMNPTALAGDGACPSVLGPRMFDRVVSTTAVTAIPPAWLARMHVGARLVTPIAGTCLLLDAERTSDGAAGTVFEHRDRIAPMASDLLPAAPRAEPDWDVPVLETGQHLGTGSYPVADLTAPSQLATLMDLAHPGIAHRHFTDPATGLRTAVMAHPDGSWARAAQLPGTSPTVHQSGPTALWESYEHACRLMIEHGQAPYLRARATVDQSGAISLTHGDWSARLGHKADMLR
jgi:protein-L-isoaspartate O-methyltransferase